MSRNAITDGQINAVIDPGVQREFRDRIATAAIAAMFCTTKDGVKVVASGDVSPNRWQCWIDRRTFDSVGDAIAAEIVFAKADELQHEYGACSECNGTDGEHFADCLGVN